VGLPRSGRVRDRGDPGGNTPRRRNAAGAWTSASTRAARVLNGNHNRRRDLGSTQVGAPRPSRAARCSASAARNTSQRSSPTPGGSATSRSCLASGGSQRYSSRNSAASRQRRDSSAPTSSTLSRAKVIGWYAGPGPRSFTPPTVVQAPGRLRGVRQPALGPPAEPLQRRFRTSTHALVVIPLLSGHRWACGIRMRHVEAYICRIDVPEVRVAQHVRPVQKRNRYPARRAQPSRVSAFGR
jgi:hypothetical protein